MGVLYPLKHGVSHQQIDLSKIKDKEAEYPLLELGVSLDQIFYSESISITT